MNDDSRRYLIEILLRAREEVSKVADKVTEALNKVVDAQKEATTSERAATTAMHEQRDELQRLHDAHVREKKDLDDQAQGLRDVANAHRANADAAKRDVQSLKEQRDIERGLADARKKQNADRVAALRQEAAELEDVNQKRDASTVMLRREAAALEAADNSAAASHQKRAAALSAEIAQSQAAANAAENDARSHESAAKSAERNFGTISREADRSGRELEKVSSKIRQVGDDSEQSSRQGQGFRGFLRNLKADSHDAELSLSKLSASMKGFQVAFAIKYAQALLSALVGLGGELIAVASSAIQAGLALGGAFAAGASQAIPVIGLLGAALARVTFVIKALNLQQQQSLVNSHDAQAKAVQQKAAADSLKSAEQGVADAHRNVLDAQNAVTLARKAAVREVEDLIAAEARAQRQFEGTQLSLEAAQAALRQAVRSGDTGSIAQAELDVRNARSDRTSAGVDVVRAHQDAIPARQKGVEGMQGLIQAQKQLADARRSEARAADALTTARQGAAAAAAKETSADDRLQAMLKQMSPVERELYQHLLNLEGIYKKAIRPITDIIVKSFTGVADQIGKVLQDPKVLAAFTTLAKAIASAITELSKLGTSKEMTGFFSFMAGEAAKNIPKIVDIIEKLWKAVKNIAVAGAPAFKMLLGFIDSLAGRADKATGNIKAMSDFFKTGIKYLERWVELGIQIARLFLSIIGASASQGTKSIKGVTDSVKDATKWVQNHGDKVRKFFADAADVVGQLWRVVKAIAQEIIRAFAPDNVKAFADFMVRVVIPALGNTVVIMGQFTQIAHEFLSLPLVSDLVQWIATVALLSKGFAILGSALKGVGAMLGFVSVEGKLAFVGSPWVLAIAAVIASIVLLDRKFHFLGPTLKWLSGAFSDAFGAIKKVAMSIVNWFSDAWNHGIFHWVNYPYIEAFKIIKGVFEKIFGVIGDAISWVTNAFSTGPGKAIFDIISAPFRLALAAIKGVFNVAKDIIGTFLDLLAGRFDTIGKRIGQVFTDVFSTMKDTIITILNVIIDAVNLAIKGFNALPFHKDIALIGRIGESNNTGPDPTTNLFGQVSPNSYQSGPLSNRAATGANVSARPGGVPVLVGEGGYDEVILTTDPRHRDRQMDLLGAWLKKSGMAFATGGFVNSVGAHIDTPGERTIATDLARLGRFLHVMFSPVGSRSARRTPSENVAVGGSPTSNHLRGLAMDVAPAIIETVSNAILNRFGLNRPMVGYAYTDSSGVAHDESNHIELLNAAITQAARGGAGLGGGTQPPVTAIPRALRGNVRHLLGKDFSAQMPGLAVNPIHSTYKMAEQAIKSMQGFVSNQQQAMLSGSGGLGLGGFSGGGSPAANKALAMKMYQAAKARLGGTFSMLDYIIMHESSYDTTVTNPNGGAYGIPQAYPGTKMASAGADWRTNPATQLKWMFGYLMSRYGGLPQAYAYKLANGTYEQGGSVPGQGAQSAIVHGGEHVWTAGEVARAGGHNVMYALRQLLGGGGQGQGSYEVGGRVIGTALGGLARNEVEAGVSRPMKQLEQILDKLSPQIENASKISTKFRKAFNLLLEDGGVLDQLANRAQAVVDQASTKLQSSEYRVTGSGPRRAGLSDVQIARSNVHALSVQRTVLDRSGEGLNEAKKVAEEAKKEAEKRLQDSKKGTKAYADAHKTLLQAEGNIHAINTRITSNNQALAQNAQDQVEGLESIQQAQLDAVGNRASNRTSSLDRLQRVLAALGHSMSPSDIIKSQINNMQTELAQLAPILASARKSGNTTLAKTIKDQMDELSTQIVEATATQFQDAIDTVNKAASDSTQSIDRDMTLAQLGGQTDYTRVNHDLASKGGVYAKQRYKLNDLLQTATAAGNIDQIKSLTGQIADLDVTIAENSQAIKDNTNAAFADRVSKINDKYGFSSGVLGAASTFFTTIGQMTGNTNLGVLQGLNQSQGAALSTQRTGLLGALGDLLGYKGDEKTGLMGLQGADLVNTLLTLSQGPVFQGIMDRLDPTQQGAFKDLVNALLGNVNATNDNTNALAALTGSTTQAWSSTSWQWYRDAIFSNNKLLPRYQIPSMDVGGRVLSDGMIYAHAGEVIPASVSRPYRGGSGDHMEAKIFVTEQVQDANEEVISARLLQRWKTRPKS